MSEVAVADDGIAIVTSNDDLTTSSWRGAVGIILEEVEEGQLPATTEESVVLSLLTKLTFVGPATNKRRLVVKVDSILWL